MQYHIQTTPIWDAFKSDCECPLCKIYTTTSERLVLQYLNEAVMEPEFRVKVNKRGFCSKHILDLYNGKNKLGLALQLNTRTEKIKELITNVKDYKQALKQAKILSDSLETCVICDTISDMMTRYAQTIAMMFVQEKEFPTLFNKTKGFCIPHYVLLLENSDKAGKLVESFLTNLVTLQRDNLTRINRDTELFTNQFDYRNSGSTTIAGNTTIPSAINKLKGTIIKF